ncbi:MAG: transposase [Polaromonas sp.]|nr:transposase [Polaromonas sp.]
MQYRRAFTPGGTFFFTLVTQERRAVFASAAAVEALRGAFRAVHTSRPFEIAAMVVMPEHLHCIWTLPPGDADFSTRWRLIKTWFTKHHAADGRAQAVWQPRYWEHQIREDADFAHHVDYIHYNPVKHGLAKSPWDWPYSSFRRHVEAGVYPANWGENVIEFKGVGHE